MRKTGEDPGFVEAGAEAGIEANCGVPAEDDPLHLPTPLSDGDTSESGHHRLAGAGSALFEQDEKILDEEHRVARESGIREVVDGERQSDGPRACRAASRSSGGGRSRRGANVWR